jgi:hypothetical protein
MINSGPPKEVSVVASGRVTEEFTVVRFTICNLLEELVKVILPAEEVVVAPPVVDGGVALAHEVPLDVRTLPDAPTAGKSEVDHVDPV